MTADSGSGSGSLRRRLMTWLLGPMVLVSTLLFFDAYRGAREVADRAYDRVIAASVLAIADRVIVVDGRLDVDLPYVALEMLSTEADDRVYYRVAEPDGTVVTGYPDLPLPPGGNFPDSDLPYFYDARYIGEPIRVGVLTQALTGLEPRGRVAVQVAQTRGQRDHLVHELASATAARLIVLLLLIGFTTWLGVRYGLAPLARIRAAVRERSPSDLRPLEVDAPREVRDVVSAINGHMDRLRRTLTSMEQFISDAAHQLRTPLASLHTQVELALREENPNRLRTAISDLRGATWRTSRLADQLLNLARSTADAQSRELELLDLAALAADVTREHVPDALQKDIDLGFEGEASAAEISGDPVLIRELVTNLVDNAIRYCPRGSTITVRVDAGVANGQVRLEVEDDGPGIPADARARAFERFHRGPGATAPGSGLGLAIAREIATLHHAAITLDVSRLGGLLVTVLWPPGQRTH